mmetsp:Transcript_129327/g.360198  ORF Transcript_129327/g.360198 Transcript_129327/m.360198 type:complete len:211 (+) Transcript_129327:616-1248(+)
MGNRGNLEHLERQQLIASLALVERECWWRRRLDADLALVDREGRWWNLRLPRHRHSQELQPRGSKPQARQCPPRRSQGPLQIGKVGSFVREELLAQRVCCRTQFSEGFDEVCHKALCNPNPAADTPASMISAMLLLTRWRQPELRVHRRQAYVRRSEEARPNNVHPPVSHAQHGPGEVGQLVHNPVDLVEHGSLDGAARVLALPPAQHPE